MWKRRKRKRYEGFEARKMGICRKEIGMEGKKRKGIKVIGKKKIE